MSTTFNFTYLLFPLQTPHSVAQHQTIRSSVQHFTSSRLFSLLHCIDHTTQLHSSQSVVYKIARVLAPFTQSPHWTLRLSTICPTLTASPHVHTFLFMMHHPAISHTFWATTQSSVLSPRPNNHWPNKTIPQNKEQPFHNHHHNSPFQSQTAEPHADTLTFWYS